MSTKSWIIFIALTIGILTSLVVFSGGSKLDVSKVDLNIVQTANSQDGNIGDHAFGKVGSPVTLIEYGDFQCPACGTYHPQIKAMIEKYADQLQFVFRNFPITSLHANAKAAAGTAEAAGLQGKYWEMHNKIYESQSSWSNLSSTERTKFFEGYATELGLDLAKFQADIAGTTNSTSVGNKIDYDYALGKKANVNGTPTFFLNGTLLDGKVWSDSTKLEAAINAELTTAGIALPATTK